ncbi:solute:sodium symporter family transporter [Vibrio natriegens]|uniref:Solute:sodium symporter family transporter n=1 Tax=Vibrio natriegens NBRC 15636 = ATCC 14048 = DSM 759 TaxID=1219067 RepID=A0AAN1CXQ8_VIBNA|nr:solute:sodium symporter family transporter [Vibrio natriegens]ALR18443.1 transporter [Vibrio natriegens NBRC 15636 = ATCC 14048 = DSM 759]ANQ14393.1 solute:sodium symporter family transporter [Vibrio natriegens NBRC 15636 = ATCC 14048 = DSM 759]EPM38743.1 AraC family transcriptional regulator [Vibrio natriegens NBRC 15636 = ATCC 14048 = DSM 759]MDX6028663.1 solute:sodium symporter family transporter [Vibrio natriegens NBRC 15636 = ATCC 14048 = DSM 759]UUI14617.1 solute:sodium symporter fami
MPMTILLSFFFFTGFVVFYTWSRVKNQKNDSKDGFFLGGRSLTGGLIASSLILTNLSATSFVGMSALSFKGNMSVMGYEVASGITLIIIALFLVPRYLKQGITTIPDFLESRYDLSVKQFVTVLFLLSYIINLLPNTLYAGAMVIGGIFDVETMLGINRFQAILLIASIIGVLGLFYAIYGGLKAVVIADTLNGVGLIVGGLMIPIFGLIVLGGGSFMEGLEVITTNATDKLQAVGAEDDPNVPFSTMFTGLLLVNLYYWGTDQAIIQRALGAKNLKEGQKGVILAGAIKVVTPLFLIIPGIIAFHMFGTADAAGQSYEADTMYTRLVNEVLPKPLVGFFLAAMFGAILSTFNGVLNSSTTLFTLNVYKPLFDKENKLSDEQLVNKGRVFGLFIAILSVGIAPFIMFAPNGLFDLLQRLAGLFSVPIFTIVFMGYITKRVPAIAAKVSLAVFVGTYGIVQFTPATMHGYLGPLKPLAELHFFHQLAVLFVICCVIMYIIGKVRPRDTDYVLPVNEAMDIKPWEFRFEASAVILYMVLGAYITFSDLGLVAGDTSFMVTYALCGIVILGGIFARIRKKQAKLAQLDPTQV